MPGKIEISNLRNIQKLHFQIPDRGVWLLTASNGAGKTSLLACLRRLGYPQSFPVHFPSSSRSPRMDDHSDGEVVYEINDERVSYAYRGERWTPRPRSNSHLFAAFGYPSVIYIGATADRITPRPEDFDTRNIRPADREIIDAANIIFETDKFSMLRMINLVGGNSAFVLALGPAPHNYHSEKHFSLGELCVLKLLRLVREADDASMIIVDELEMALHPRAQVELLRYLQRKATDKHLTVIFSTHSVTLLKTIDRRHIIYLEKQDDGEITPIYGCFATYAIGNLASGEEKLPDLVLYTEDVVARDMMGAFYSKFVDEKFRDPTMRPTIKIVPIGGFKEVVSFLERNRGVLPETCLQYAVLDGDVKDETLVVWQNENRHAQLARFQAIGQSIKYLPFTPELGLMEYILSNLDNFERELRNQLGDNQVRIRTVARTFDQNLRGRPLRNSAKNAMKALLDHIAPSTHRTPDAVREIMCKVFANSGWQTHRAAFMALFGQMIG